MCLVRGLLYLSWFVTGQLSQTPVPVLFWRTTTKMLKSILIQTQELDNRTVEYRTAVFVNFFDQLKQPRARR